MKIRKINAPDAPMPVGGYAQALEVTEARRFLFISGQIPQDLNGKVPSDFASQCRLVWSNILAQLRAADMSVSNLVRVTIYLSDRAHALENRAIRNEILKGHEPAMTVIITGIFDSTWLLEIDAIAAE